MTRQRQATMTMLVTFADALQEGRARASEHWRRDGEIQLVVHKAAEDAKGRGREARGTQHRSAKLTVVMDQLLAQQRSLGQAQQTHKANLQSGYESSGGLAPVQVGMAPLLQS